MANFDKSELFFPVKRHHVFLAHCGVSPLYGPAAQRQTELAVEQSIHGGLVFKNYDAVLTSLRRSAAELLEASPDDLSFVRNTTEGMSLIANGYPFREGDEVVTFTHEYPANYYPWLLQARRRGVRVVELPNVPIEGGPKTSPGSWSLDDLRARMGPRTRLVALSHVQFTSGFTFDLDAVAELCASRGVDLVIDAAQSLGAMPLPTRGIAAVVSSGWKWLLGPVGTGLLYTSPAFRPKLEPVIVGAEVMKQGLDYLDHTWAPHATGKRFEYSTSSMALAASLQACLAGVACRYGPRAIFEELLSLQRRFLERLDRTKYGASEPRSTILSLWARSGRPSEQLVLELEKKNVIVTARGGFLRIAPHFYNSPEDLETTASLLNAIG